LQGLNSLAVIEEETGKLLGLISQTSLIIEATRFEEKEISELKERNVIWKS
jgi:glycine betaine/proline transport system ATP-binding protein